MEVVYSPFSHFLTIRGPSMLTYTVNTANVSYISAVDVKTASFTIVFGSMATTTKYHPGSYDGVNKGKPVSDEVVEQKHVVKCPSNKQAQRCRELVSRVLSESAVILNEFDVYGRDDKILDAPASSGHVATATTAPSAPFEESSCSAT